MSEVSAPIVLARETPFALGPLTVRPATREVVRDDGAVEVLEPRVMQVLVALHRTGGDIVARDDLTHSCWEGRVVGEDAINRVISRLRRTADGIGGGAFRIETVTKVGYRLIQNGQPATTDPPQVHVARSSRRAVVIGLGAGTAIAVGAGVALWPRSRAAAPFDPRIAGMMQAGFTNFAQTTGDGFLQARGLFHRVTELAPEYPDGWAALALVYGSQHHSQPEAQAADLGARAREAIRRARSIEPDAYLADLAETNLLPYNAWAEWERRLRALLDRRPDDDLAQHALGRVLARVGRMGEAADLVERAFSKVESAPVNAFDLMSWQWAAGRTDAADRTIDRARALFPRNFSVWFGTFYIRLYSGRVDDAIAMAEDLAGRPATIPDSEIEQVLVVARALKSREPQALAALRTAQLARARVAAGQAENAIQLLCAAGITDDAMMVAEAYFLDRGFHVPSIRFPQGQGSYTHLPDRRTWFLFYPVTAPLRAHPRFPALLAAVGLDRYWREVGKEPDYRRIG